MTIASQLQDYADGLDAAYTAISGRGGTMPARKNLDNLPTAINTIPSGGGSFSGIPKEVDANGVWGPPTSAPFSVLAPTVVSIATPAINAAFKNSSITSIDFRALSQAGASLKELCSGATSLTSADFRSLTTMTYGGMMFKGCTSLTKVDLRSLQIIGTAGSSRSDTMSGAFRGCTSLTSIGKTDQDSVNLASLREVYYDGLNSAFRECTSLQTVDLSSLVEAHAFQYTFQDCTALRSLDMRSVTGTVGTTDWYYMCTGCSSLESVDVSSLTTVNGVNAMRNSFSGTKLTSVTFPALTKIAGTNAMSRCFENCSHLTSLSFPSLNDLGTDTNQLNGMITGCSDVTIHFPAAMQTAISALPSYPNFGGTNTTVLFDL